MPNFISVVDNNTKNVYRWIRLSEDGTKVTVNIPRTSWKPLNAWTQTEIEELFGPRIIAVTKIPDLEFGMIENSFSGESHEVIVIQKTDEPLVLFDVAPELVETPTIPEEIVINEAVEPAQEEQSPTFFGTNNS